MRSDRGGTALAAVLLVAVTFLVYWPALSGEFLWDDRESIPQNPVLRAADGLVRIWTDPAANPATEQHYPLVDTTFWVEHQLWGDRPTGYHVVNVLLHALNALLVWRLLARLGVPAAWFAGWLFALHPVHVESTAWIIERKDLLSTLFYLLAALAYERHDRTGRWTAYCAALVAFTAAMLSKTMVATFPIAILLVLWWKRGRLTRRDGLRVLPFAVIAFGLFVASYQLLVHPDTLVQRPRYNAEIDLSLAERVLVAGRALCFYAGQLIWPVGLSASYPKWVVAAGEAWQWLFPTAVVAAVVALAALRRRIGRGPLVALLYYALTIGPALGWFSFYLMAYTYVADRFQYLAAVGPFALVAAGVARLVHVQAPRRIAAWGGIAALLVTLGWLSFDRCRDYRALETLLEDAIAKGSSSARLHYYVAQAHERKGRLDRAIEHYRQVIALDPRYYLAHVNLGYHLMNAGRPAEAIPLFEAAIRLRPDEDVLGRNNLAVALADRGQLDRAIELLREAVALEPDDEMSRINLGYFLLRQGNRAQAAEQFERVLARNPASSLAVRGLAEARR